MSFVPWCFRRDYLSTIYSLLHFDLVFRMSSFGAQMNAVHGRKPSAAGRMVKLVPSQHRYMTYHDGHGGRHYVDFVGRKVGFTQVCWMASLTNVSFLNCLFPGFGGFLWRISFSFGDARRPSLGLGDMPSGGFCFSRGCCWFV